MYWVHVRRTSAHGDQIRRDARIKWIAKPVHKRREARGLTSVGKHVCLVIEMLLRHSKDFVRTAGSAKATDTTTRLVWRHGKGTTRSACVATDDSAVLRVRFLIIVMITKPVPSILSLVVGSVTCRCLPEKRASTSCIGRTKRVD
jgi:hypothetical protein